MCESCHRILDLRRDLWREMKNKGKEKTNEVTKLLSTIPTTKHTAFIAIEVRHVQHGRLMYL